MRYAMTSTSKPQVPPVTLRLDEDHRKTLDDLAAARDITPSEVLRLGLRLMARTQNSSSVPLYPRLVDEQQIDEAIEEATSAACQVLDRLFPAKGKEVRGISSNFQGTLKEHIEAMLTGKEASSRSYARHINTLFGDYRALGRLRRSAEAQEGYGIIQLPTKPFEEPTFFHSDKNRLVELNAVGADTLFTSEDAALKAAYAWMAKEELSPRDLPLRLCLLSWAGGDGPLKVTEIAD
jgi:antitoxin component of RelBE/YafQ-DinJ toxin-antitoxin module